MSETSEISGIVVDKYQNPVSGISLELIAQAKLNTDRFYNPETIYVREGGTFSRKGVQLGKYILAINYVRDPDDRMPYRTTFYPNTAVRDEAKVFDIKPGTKFTKLLVQLPEKLEKRKIRGTVYWKSGSPTGKIELLFTPTEVKRWAGKFVSTDSDGRFEVELFTGRTYVIEKAWQNTLYKQFRYNVVPSSKKFEIKGGLDNIKIVLNADKPDR